MTTLTIYETRTHFSDIINRVLMGEKIVIARGHKPVVALMPIKQAQTTRRFGGAVGAIKHIAADFDAPLADFISYSP